MRVTTNIRAGRPPDIGWEHALGGLEEKRPSPVRRIIR
jgi:hypothetical protein